MPYLGIQSNVAKSKTKFDEALAHVRSEKERMDAEIRDMERDLDVKQKHSRKLAKAIMVLGGAVESAPSESVTLEIVNKAIIAAFGSQEEMPEQLLRTGVLESLKADPMNNLHGLGLRVSQAMKRLKRNTAGLVLRPAK